MDIAKALGKPHSLWVAFAKFYERHGDVDNARIIFQQATQVRLRRRRRGARAGFVWVVMGFGDHPATLAGAGRRQAAAAARGAPGAAPLLRTHFPHVS